MIGLLDTPSDEGLLAAYTVVHDDAWRDVTIEDLVSTAPDWALLLLADEVTLTSPELLVLVLQVQTGMGRKLRVTPAAMWSIENNVSLANMDWEDFENAADPDGAFRGFG